jgi:F-type H+-transporting ATPase subunit delta
MPLLNSIATPYAEALLQVAESRKETDAVAEQAKALLAVLSSSPELKAALASPVLEPEAKKAALAKLFDDQVTPAVQNLLKPMMEAVLMRFLELYRELRNITLAKVTSAAALSEEQQAELNRKVQEIAGSKSVEFDLVVDPSLIGGFIVSMGSQVIDASLSGQVRRLGLALAQVS